MPGSGAGDTYFRISGWIEAVILPPKAAAQESHMSFP